MLLGRKRTDLHTAFRCRLDVCMPLFGAAAAKQKGETGDVVLSDEAFVNCYIAGMAEVIRALNQWAVEDLSGDGRQLQYYRQVMENPSRWGFRFQNEELTIGKIYLYYIWAKTRKKASKSECIRLERHALQQIRQQCVELGMIH